MIRNYVWRDVPVKTLYERLRLRSERNPPIAYRICPVKLLDRSKTDIIAISFSYLYRNPLNTMAYKYKS